MRVGVVGINAKSSELSFREHLAKAALKIFGAEIVHLNSLLLSTCHRTEIYFSSEDLAETHSELLNLLRQEIHVPFEHKLYAYFGEECFVHLSTVVSGLDSIILGESEIQRQVKRAYENALVYRQLPSSLHFLFQKSFKISKELRSSDYFPQGQLSLEKVIFQLFKGCVREKGPVLFVGNSAINRKILSFLKKKNVENIALCTRAMHSAKDLMQDNIHVMGWEKLSSWPEFSMVISGTNQSGYLMSADQIVHPMHTQVILDLSVPRNVDPKIGRHPQITLLNIEEVCQLLQEKEGKHREGLQACKEKLRLLVERQMRIFHEKEEAILCPI
jgi:glutamyl-tRNA reductase